jgi:hypothetical protein
VKRQEMKDLSLALKKVEALLTAYGWPGKAPKGQERGVAIYAWPVPKDRHPGVGLRISEVTFWEKGEEGTQGSSYQQSEPGACQVILLAERLALDFVEKIDDTDRNEFVADAQRLICAACGMKAANRYIVDANSEIA